MAHNYQKVQFHEYVLNVSLNVCCIQLFRDFKLVEHVFFWILTVSRLAMAK